MIETELAWAAGLFDGEGNVLRTKRDGGLKIQVFQVDREVLDRFHSAVGAGKVYGPYGPYKTQRQPIHHFTVDRQADVRAVMRRLWPYLGTVKRCQYLRALRGR